MTEAETVPDMDARWPALLAAGRAWRASLIPKTSTGIAGPTQALIAAIESFDQCDHPRAQLVFFRDDVDRTGLHTRCGKCGVVLT
jgi:hypothetical protein